MDYPTRDGIGLNELADKLGWIEEYRDDLSAWGELLDIVSQTESFVRANGFYRGCFREMKRRLSFPAHTRRSARVRSELLSFVAGKSFKAKGNERMVGSSPRPVAH
jgi:hypothetical protein